MINNYKELLIVVCISVSQVIDFLLWEGQKLVQIDDMTSFIEPLIKSLLVTTVGKSLVMYMTFLTLSLVLS